jgi:hypothetical protein
MRKAMLLLAVFELAGSLWAADPFIGTWELKVAKSKLPSALFEAPGIPGPKQETIVVRELDSDEIEVIVRGTNTDGSPNSQKYAVPKQGGIERYQEGAPPNGSYYVQIRVDEKEKYRTLLENGKQGILQHIVIAQNGKAANLTITFIDKKGLPIEGQYFFEKQ